MPAFSIRRGEKSVELATTFLLFTKSLALVIVIVIGFALVVALHVSLFCQLWHWIEILVSFVFGFKLSKKLPQQSTTNVPSVIAPFYPGENSMQCVIVNLAAEIFCFLKYDDVKFISWKNFKSSRTTPIRVNVSRSWLIDSGGRCQIGNLIFPRNWWKLIDKRAQPRNYWAWIGSALRDRKVFRVSANLANLYIAL